jgi:outer membrane protein
MRLLFSLSIVLITYTGVNAQVWTLDKCVSYAMENNLNIKLSKINVDLAEINKLDSRFAMYPNLNASASQSNSFGRAINPFTNTYVSQNVSSLNLNGSTNVTVFNGFNRMNNLKSDKESLEAEKLSLEKSRNDVALFVINAYMNVLYTQDLVRVAKEQLDVTKSQLDRSEKNAAVGNATQGDVLNIKSQVATDELNVTTAQNNLDIARLNLIQLLDRDPGEGLEVVRPENVDQYLTTNTFSNLQDVYATAESTLPDIKILEYRYNAAKYSLAAAKGSLYPRLNLGAGLGSDYADVNPLSFTNQLENNFSKFVSFQLSVPIFNGYSARNNVKRATIALTSAEINRQQSKLTLSKNIQQAIADLRAAKMKYESTQKSTQSLKEAFKYSQQRFDVGLLNSVDYGLSKNNVARSEADLIQAKYELILKAKLLDFYNGKPLTF